MVYSEYYPTVWTYHNVTAELAVRTEAAPSLWTGSDQHVFAFSRVNVWEWAAQAVTALGESTQLVSKADATYGSPSTKPSTPAPPTQPGAALPQFQSWCALTLSGVSLCIPLTAGCQQRLPQGSTWKAFRLKTETLRDPSLPHPSPLLPFPGAVSEP